MRWLLPFVVLSSCTGPATTPAPLVLLVSFDTTRADALSCYGATDAHTPHVDSLAASGVRFERAISSSSTTLAAHTAIFSGEDSHAHAVPRNGFRVPGGLPLLAERFASRGWMTAASVGSYALERPMGLHRGFTHYEDHAGWQAALLGLYEVNGRTVTETALQLVDRREGDQPVFLFVHYYDAHMPWSSAPDHIRARFVDPNYRGPVTGDRAGIGFLTEQTMQGTLSPTDRDHARRLYLAEVAWADRQLGQLLRGLEARNLLHDSLIAVFSDHGEMFDEEPNRPWRHGPDVDLPIVQVPMVLRGTGRFTLPAETVVPETVRTLDLGSTLLAAIGDPQPLGQGQDLAPLWSDHPPADWPLALAEATQPLEQTGGAGWPNALLEKAVVSQTHIVTRAPWLHQSDRAWSLRTGVLSTQAAPEPLTRALDAFDARMPGPRAAELHPTTRAALQSLGYLDDGADSP